MGDKASEDKVIRADQDQKTFDYTWMAWAQDGGIFMTFYSALMRSLKRKPKRPTQ